MSRHHAVSSLAARAANRPGQGNVGQEISASDQGARLSTRADANQRDTAQFRRTVVDYPTVEPPGTIIIDTPNRYLYLTLGNGKAIRYGVGVGREGFTWSGTERISRMKEWPDWFPPKETITRQPYLPRFMAGGETNPLGARDVSGQY